MNWFEDQITNRLQNDQEEFSNAFCELASVVMGDEAAKAGLITPRQKTGNAIQEILKYFGQRIPEVPDSITEADAYIDFCIKPSGIMKRRVTLTGKWWRDAFGPMLGVLESGDAVALLPTGTGYVYFDYERGSRVIVNAKTAEHLKPQAYCFYKPFADRALSIMDLVKYIFRTVTKADIVFYLAVMLITTLLGLIQPRISLILYNLVIPQGNTGYLLPLGAFMLSMAVATLILEMSNELIMNRLTMRLSNTVEPAAMMRLLSLPPEFFKKYASGELSEKFSLIPAISSSIFSVITGTLITSLFSLAYFTQISSITPALLAPSLAMIGATLLLNIVTTLASIKIQRQSLDASAELNGMTYALLSSIQKVKLTGSEKRVFARWVSKYRRAANFSYNPPFILKYSSVLTSLISGIGIAVVYFVAIMSRMGVGEYMAYNTAYGMVSASIMSIGSLTTFFSGLKPQLDIVEPLMKAEPEVTSGKAVVTQISGGVELQNVVFRYDDNSKNVIDDISLKIRPGRYVAFVGRTGCGKSTLVRLMLGFEKPAKGAIYYDNRDMAALDLPSLRRKIGTVMQNSKLFTGDIFSNIVISAPGLTLEDAWEAARIADIAKDIEDMPMGMHTIITEGSGGVSGGQKQRLMIARAVAPKPKLLIFDESTSALDNITQKNVSDALANLKCTRIVIAHRLSTIKHCDWIYVIDDGKIAEEGTFDSLYASKGYFYTLVNRQMVGEHI